MKTILLIILTAICNDATACVCLPIRFREKFTESDFVAHVKVVKVYKNEGDDPFYKSDILIYDLFKGERIATIQIEGSSIPNERRSSCDLFFPENTELIVYASKKPDGQYHFDSCSGSVQITGKYENEKRELAMLHDLRQHHINFTSKISFYKMGDFKTELEPFNNIKQLSKAYALFEITFSSHLTVKSVKVVSGFGTDIDDKLKAILQNAEWLSTSYDTPQNTIIKNEVLEDSKLLMGFYFYPSDKGYESFVSEYDL